MKPTCCQPQSKEAKNIKQIADYIRALDEPNRLKILCLLKRGERCVCDIFEPLNLPQNLVSHHLKALRDVGLIDFRKEGTRVIYFRNEQNITHFQRLLKNIINP